jgi:hypothetical protein
MAPWYTYEDCCVEFSTRLVWSSVGWLLIFLTTGYTDNHLILKNLITYLDDPIIIQVGH